MRTILAYLSGVVLTYLLAAAASTQHVMAQLGSMGVAVPFGERIRATLHDIVGMASSFLPLVAVGCLIAYPIAGLLARKWPTARTGLFIAAGAVAVLTIHMALDLSFGIKPVAASRTAGGLIVQGLAGALGGWLFVLVKPGKPKKAT